MTRSSRPCRQLPTDLSNGTCRSGAMSFCTFLLSTESSASPGLVLTSPRKAPPGLAPFLLTSCQVRVALRRRMADGRAMLLHREIPDESFRLVCETIRRWKLRGLHIFD
ncbi:hypothetical protein ALC60_11864 [Trachymyrmex zeteki]|uniref:Uncharacterized protein n=1 Tax=Mycetomoellerius zeteki TaxID=64791 RepID=A0A151WMP5_9HYME|nr:hypothetical protein ALC60_11864 [Trachymyrmex zeteki]